MHTGAVYVHQGATYVVDHLDLDDAVAVAHREDVDWTTSARDTTDIRIVDEIARRSWGAADLVHGHVEVTNQVVSYLKRRYLTGAVLGEEPLDLPPRHLRTQAVWWTVAPEQLRGRAAATTSTCRAPRMPPSTPRSACCRWSRPATGGTSAASRPRCTRTPAA